MHSGIIMIIQKQRFAHYLIKPSITLTNTGLIEKQSYYSQYFKTTKISGSKLIFLSNGCTKL